VVFDCGALPATLVESQLFGYERGAFSGAEAARPGLFEAAHAGTLFLDEIGELSLELQPKLLRVLESRQVQRIGSSALRPADVRVIAATNRNLRSEVNAGRFRSDLYYRLAVLDLTLPPLRDRLEDIPLLVDELLLEYADEVGEEAVAYLRSREGLERLSHHAWPGNVRELKNYVARSLAMNASAAPEAAAAAAMVGAHAETTLEVARQHWERQFLEAVLIRHGHRVPEAALACGISRVHLHRLMTRYGLRRG
jgi:transcriptional regulator with PAS, ATPase and Fis domain